MKCPVDGSELVMSERQNVEIDYCPQCRGVWLDRGELDKIIERIETEGVVPARHSQPQPQSEAYRETYHPPRKEYRDYDDDDHKHGYRKKHHRESWLGDLFG